ncbi:MAG: membrane protein insertion efficiency factor YidD [Patescibacteria group bacterium]
MKILVFVIKLYQHTLSPILRVLFGPGCRYEITCSQYAVNVIGRYGVIKGASLTLKRISTCHI